MTRFLVHRLLSMAMVVFVVISAAFFVLSLAPGDPAYMAAGPQTPREEIERLRIELGLHLPLHIQYVNFLGRVVNGDLGISFWSRRPVTQELLVRLPYTARLAALGLGLAILFGIVSGVICAVNVNSPIDYVTMMIVNLGIAMPIFWVGLLSIYLFAVVLRVLPSAGYSGPLSYILPSFCLSLNSGVIISRLTKSSMLEIIGLDFVRTARAKGLSERAVIYKHALRNAMMPIVTIIGLRFGALLGGAAVTEAVFAWPGIGKLIVDAALQRDIPLVVGGTIVIAIAVAGANLLVDIMYMLIDPRVKVS